MANGGLLRDLDSVDRVRAALNNVLRGKTEVVEAWCVVCDVVRRPRARQRQRERCGGIEA
ncbi:MAG: hypothetical protein IT428_09510 [Planctomycetaceae bacterium]|nr:hypothetical protein [Planctomycetaceae bacterium]